MGFRELPLVGVEQKHIHQHKLLRLVDQAKDFVKDRLLGVTVPLFIHKGPVRQKPHPRCGSRWSFHAHTLW